jgi:hypothetical protein
MRILGIQAQKTLTIMSPVYSIYAAIRYPSLPRRHTVHGFNGSPSIFRAHPAWANTARAEYSSGSLAILAAMFVDGSAGAANHETTARRLRPPFFLRSYLAAINWQRNINDK